MKTCNKYIVENKHILFHKDKTIRNPSDTICWYQIFNKLTLIKYVTCFNFVPTTRFGFSSYENFNITYKHYKQLSLHYA